MKPAEVLFFYRIFNWRGKISCLRPLAYTALGYALAGHWEMPAAIGNALAILGILACSYAVNDYYDYQLKGEDNFAAFLSRSGKMPRGVVLALGFLPLILCVFLPWNSALPVILAGVLLVLTILYSLPPFRLKERKVIGFAVPPLCAVVIFFQGYFIFGLDVPQIRLFGVIVLLFHLYVETLHQIADLVGGEGRTGSNMRRLVALTRLFPALSLLLSVVFALYNPWFLVTTFFSAVRLAAVRRTDLEGEIFRIRKRFLSPVWSVYEFAVYGLLGILGF